MEIGVLEYASEQVKKLLDPTNESDVEIVQGRNGVTL